MHCSRCGSPLAPNTAFCGACGAPVAVGVQPASFKRPPIISLLAILQFIGGAFWILGAVAALFVAVRGSGEAASDAITLVAGVVCGAIGALQVMCGSGLWNLKPIGRTLQRIFAFIGLLGFPLGTVISILILVYLNKPGIKVLFSGKLASDLTHEELAQVAAVPQSSVLIVIVIAVVVGIFGVATLGIVAAITVPALLRARISANEASAIGALRAINSAEVSYATACAAGGYAVTLEDLARAPRDASTGFISADLNTNGVEKAGYRIAVTRDATAGVSDVGPAVGTCNGSTNAPASSYFASAEPITPGGTGIRYFATDARGIIVSSTEPITNPIVASPPLVPVQ
jgi:type IV pilus assembly protein PilA